MPHLDRLKAKRSGPRGSRSGHTNNKTSRSRLTKTERNFISRRIRTEIKKGKPQKQAIAIGFSKARKKFGDKPSLNPKMSGHTNNTRGTRRLLTTLLGAAIALTVLRQITRSRSTMHKSGHRRKNKGSSRNVRRRSGSNPRNLF